MRLSSRGHRIRNDHLGGEEDGSDAEASTAGRGPTHVSGQYWRLWECTQGVGWTANSESMTSSGLPQLLVECAERKMPSLPCYLENKTDGGMVLSWPRRPRAPTP